ncbi:hypothetical protein [Chitinophaga japonensis]|uniref:Lipocalin-like protein n=1 Tax=Chitinophaga japonensis TaxID=104662 RepID=A0A562SYY5_CHIJA|nr:hypothetical protein [Chitinophaga japonensis]TWI86529.1 hypothetical protein LX66_3787 [Chitinophaga japonensis]
MRKVLVIMICGLLFACKKEDNTTPHRSFYGKWTFQTAIARQYTVIQGDTTYHSIDTVHYNGSDYIDFTENGVALSFTAQNQRTDTLGFEEITPRHFRLDSLLCEATLVTDSALHYNSLDFSYNETPYVQISQTFFILRR